MIRPTHLRCEYLVDPLAIDTQHPRLSWALEHVDARRGARQTAYHIVVQQADGEIVWDTGRVESEQTTHIVYAGRPLRQTARYEWRLRVWDERDEASDWSVAAWTMGRWGPGWTNARGHDGGADDLPAAAWIGAPLGDPWSERASQPSTYLRRQFTLAAPVRRAVVYASALGVYELRINGQRGGDHILAPEWTDYDTKVQYQGYDFAPHPFDPNARFSGNPGWGDAGVIIPWRMYLNYGDTRILEEMFEPA